MWNHVEITYLDGFDISHAFKLHEGLPVICEGPPVMQRVCLSCAMTAIVIHACHNDVMM